MQAKADKVQGTLVRVQLLQKTAPVKASAEALTSADVSSVAEINLDEKDIDTNKVQSSTATPSTPKLEANPVDASTETPTFGDIPSVTNLSSDEGKIDTNDPMSQVTNVSQLRDVSPGDWAYEGLRSLVERYGCIAGYPDGTFRGNRATSRFEFAAGLNACLQQIEKLIAANSASFVTQQDLSMLQRLTDEFKTELATLSTRADKLDSRIAPLEEHQFSTTTRVNGLAWFNVTGATAGGDVKVETTNLNGINGDISLRQPGRENGKPAVRVVKNNPNITSYVKPYSVLDGRNFLVSGGGDGGVF